MSRPWYEMKTEDTMKRLGSSWQGLKSEDVNNRLEKYGTNELERIRKINPLEVFFRQFKNLLIVILFFAAAISFFVGDSIDAILIFIMIFILVMIGFVQEYRAERSLDALRKLTSPKANVFRDGKEMEILAKDIVPGDIIILQAGDKIPADARVLESISMEIDESMLTGESVPVSKITNVIKSTAPIQERYNMVFMGTIVSNGRGRAIVVNTGMQTEIGKIAKIVQVEQRETPLKKKLNQLSKHLAIIIGIISAVIFLIGIFRGEELSQMFLTSVALAVSAIPQALPLIVTVTLAIGVHQMVKKKSIVRSLPAVETLGSVTVIASDKTGTLTKNEMTVREIYTDKKIVLFS